MTQRSDGIIQILSRNQSNNIAAQNMYAPSTKNRREIVTMQKIDGLGFISFEKAFSTRLSKCPRALFICFQKLYKKVNNETMKTRLHDCCVERLRYCCRASLGDCCVASLRDEQEQQSNH
jgi:hypothetical protein